MARNCGLATCSLILGILGVFTVGILSIPAVITGHLALGKINRSAGTLSGKGAATAGLITGYLGLVVVPVLAIAGFAGGTVAIAKAKEITAQAAATSLQTAIEQFYVEYSTMPTAANKLDTEMDASLVRVVTGVDKTLNPRSIRFLSLPSITSKKGGMDPVTQQLFDPWGNGYQVIIDVHSSGSITVTRGSIVETVTGRRAVVFSLGKDGIAGTADDVITW